MPNGTFFITGTDTGVGKTVLTALLARHLRNSGVAVAALKPVCSGDREDGRTLYRVLNGTLTLDEINPWYFRAPLAPVLAARRDRKCVKLAHVLVHVRSIRERFEVVLVEGAGGLLSPLGHDFNARDLIAALRATPIVVCPNRVGAVNQALLVMEALPRAAAKCAQLVLMSAPRPDSASRTNARLLAEFLGAKRVHLFPRLAAAGRMEHALASVPARRVLSALLGGCKACQEHVNH